jgi:hypothetical protein
MSTTSTRGNKSCCGRRPPRTPDRAMPSRDGRGGRSNAKMHFTSVANADRHNIVFIKHICVLQVIVTMWRHSQLKCFIFEKRAPSFGRRRGAYTVSCALIGGWFRRQKTPAERKDLLFPDSLIPSPRIYLLPSHVEWIASLIPPSSYPPAQSNEAGKPRPPRSPLHLLRQTKSFH